MSISSDSTVPLWQLADVLKATVFEAKANTEATANILRPRALLVARTNSIPGSQTYINTDNQ